MQEQMIASPENLAQQASPSFGLKGWFLQDLQ